VTLTGRGRCEYNRDAENILARVAMDPATETIIDYLKNRSFLEAVGFVATVLICRWVYRYRKRFDDFWDGVFDFPKTLNELHIAINKAISVSAQSDQAHAEKLDRLIVRTDEINSDQKKILNHLVQAST
jgi:hypothetical protein